MGSRKVGSRKVGSRKVGSRKVARDATFDQLADKLYARPLAEFTATRNAEAKAARAAGDPRLADALQALRKPTTAAWLANTLVRERPHQIGRLLELGDELRRAQAALDADALRRLSQARHDLVRELSSVAREVAKREGTESVGTSTLRELEATLEAALLESQAAEELRRGRLTGALSYSGLGFPSPGGSPGSLGERTGSTPTGRRREASNDRRRSQEKGLGAKRSGAKEPLAKGSSTTARRRAQREADDARRTLTRAASALSAAQRAADKTRNELAAAEAELGRRREAVRAADREVRRARGERDAAERAARRAERALEAAWAGAEG